MGEWRRQNGWSWPPSTLQIISWLSIIILFPVNVLLIIPAHCIFLLAIAAIIFTWIILLMIISTTINPAIRGLKNEAVVFDKTKHLHVIEDNYCNICLIKVDRTCKHCRQCNKCIIGFDHHCKWLNNCIGAANYRLFIVLVASVTISSFIMFIILFVLLVISFTTNSLNFNYEKFVLLKDLWRIFCAICCVIYFANAIVCANLLIFHYKLWRTGVTTYHFLKIQADANIDKGKSENYIHTISETIRKKFSRNFFTSRAIWDSQNNKIPSNRSIQP